MKVRFRSIALYGMFLAASVAGVAVAENNREKNQAREETYMSEVKRLDRNRYHRAMQKYYNFDIAFNNDDTFWKRQYNAAVDSLRSDSTARANYRKGFTVLFKR